MLLVLLQHFILQNFSLFYCHFMVVMPQNTPANFWAFVTSIQMSPIIYICDGSTGRLLFKHDDMNQER